MKTLAKRTVLVLALLVGLGAASQALAGNPYQGKGGGQWGGQSGGQWGGQSGGQWGGQSGSGGYASLGGYGGYGGYNPKQGGGVIPGTGFMSGGYGNFNYGYNGYASRNYPVSRRYFLRRW